ncbi:MAG: OB-fold domain-containing protein [Chloroflexi bacterium]|nr:OB-fold domain-containing protein [Chloroflexota bacterium]
MTSAPARGKKQIPIEEGLFISLPQEGVRLCASTCRWCGETVFPKRDVCPHCFAPGMEEALLGPKGRIYTYTVVWQAPVGFLGPLPYALAVVEFPQRVLVTSLMAQDTPLDSLRIGQEVELALEKVTENEVGDEIVAYMFRPTLQEVRNL